MSDLNENYSDNPGTRLRRAREACGLSLGDVASHLKLSSEIIESLEKGEVESIAAPVFVAGYLRSYARLVNISGDDVIADFKALAAMDTPSMDLTSGPAANDYGQVEKTSSLNMSLSSETNGIAGIIILGTVTVVLVVAGYVYFSGKEVAPGIKIPSINYSTTMNLNGLPPQKGQPDVSPGDGTTNIEPINPESSERSTEAEVTAEETTKAAIPAPFSASSEDDSKSSDQSENYAELTLSFATDSWVEVKDSEDKRLLYQMGKSGTSRTVTGLAPFKVRLGFVNGVSIMYNSKPYDLSLYENRKSVRFQIGKKGDRMSRAD